MTDSNDVQVNSDFGWTADFDSVTIPDPIEHNHSSLNQINPNAAHGTSWPGDTSQTLNRDTFDTIDDNGLGSGYKAELAAGKGVHDSPVTESSRSDPKPNEIVVTFDEIVSIFNSAFKKDGTSMPSMSPCDQSSVLDHCSVEEWSSLVNVLTTNLGNDL